MAIYIHPGVDSGLHFQAGSRLPPQGQTYAERLEAPWTVHSEMPKELETNISSARHEHPERKGLACNDMLTSFFGEDIAQVQSGSFPHLCFISLHSRKSSANSFFPTILDISVQSNWQPTLTIPFHHRAIRVAIQVNICTTYLTHCLILSNSSMDGNFKQQKQHT